MTRVIIMGWVCLLMACRTAESRQFTLNYDVTLSPNTGSQTRVWIPIPRDTPAQKISNLKIRSDVAYELKSDDLYGNRYLYAQINEPVDTPVNIDIQMDVLRREREVLTDKKIPAHLYLQGKHFVPVNDFFKDILIRNNLTGTGEQAARKIYNFILDYMIYAKPGNALDDAKEFPAAYERYVQGTGWGRGDAVYACEIGVGNCTDYHSYFMSLARSEGIPVRFHMGLPVPEGESGEISGYHCWADFYIPEKGWIPVDISEADKHPEKSDYYFGRLDPDRVSFTMGRDIPLYNLNEGTTNYFIYPIVEIDTKQSTAFTRKFTFLNK